MFDKLTAPCCAGNGLEEMMEVLTMRLLDFEKLCDKYVKEKNGKVAYLFARNRTVVSGPLKDMRELTESTPAMNEFAKARRELAKEYADMDDDGFPMQEVDKNTGQTRYIISRMGAFVDAVEKLLLEKHPQAKIDQDEIEKKSEEILKETVDLKFHRMELNKIPGFRHEKDEDNGIIEAGDLAVLFELDILYEKEAEEDNVTELDSAKKKPNVEQAKTADN